MDRSKARTIARDTLRILDDGHYVAPSGARVAVRAHVDAAVAGTRDTRPDDPLAIAAGARTTRLEVTPESTMEAGERLAREGTRPALLNFASAHKPGGGFLGGAIAQEECLARSSGLYPCLRASAMYAHHAPLRGGTYTHWVVHSPAVPFFRDDRGALLEEPWRADVVTSAAVNAGVVLEREPERAGEVERLMRERTARVLGVFAARGAEAIVLGAWGCGVFRNDPTVVARLFDEALAGPFAGVFARVVFAVLDQRPGAPVRGAFEARFAGRAT